MTIQFLIVEDDHTLRKQLKEYLSSAVPVLDISEAKDGVEAFDEIGRRVPHIILMDIKLPGENGLQLTEKIKAKFPKTVVVIHTNYDSPEYWETAYSRGADYFLSKNKNNIRDLVSLTEKICEQFQKEGLGYA